MLESSLLDRVDFMVNRFRVRERARACLKMKLSVME